jgi:hypothetical protein
MPAIPDDLIEYYAEAYMGAFYETAAETIQDSRSAVVEELDGLNRVAINTFNKLKGLGPNTLERLYAHRIRSDEASTVTFHDAVEGVAWLRDASSEAAAAIRAAPRMKPGPKRDDLRRRLGALAADQFRQIFNEEPTTTAERHNPDRTNFAEFLAAILRALDLLGPEDEVKYLLTQVLQDPSRG